MSVYAVQQLLVDGLRITTSLFGSYEKAIREAAFICVIFNKNLSVYALLCNSHQSALNKIESLYYSSQYEEVLQLFKKYNDELPYDQQMFIKVLKFDLDFLETVKPTIPCKLCKTSLNENETPCWKCGLDNPTKN